MKINKTLIRVILVSAIAMVAVLIATYYFMLSLTEPEQRLITYTYTRNIEKGTIIGDYDIKLKMLARSNYSYGLADDPNEVVGKKLMTNVGADELIYMNKLTDRGRVETDFDNLYILGIDVTNISNLLGTQLKEGDIYNVLGAKAYDLNTKELSLIKKNKDNIEITIIALVDSTGNIVLGDRQTPIKTINVGVKTEEQLISLSNLERTSDLYLVRYPVKEEKHITLKKVNDSKVNTKTITLKNGVMFYVD